MNTYAIDGLHFCGHGIDTKLPELKEGCTLLVRYENNFMGLFLADTGRDGPWVDAHHGYYPPIDVVEWWLFKPEPPLTGPTS